MDPFHAIAIDVVLDAAIVMAPSHHARPCKRAPKAPAAYRPTSARAGDCQGNHSRERPQKRLKYRPSARSQEQVQVRADVREGIDLDAGASNACAKGNGHVPIVLA